MSFGPAHRAVLSRDTSREIERRQIDAWRGMSPAEKLALVASASRAARLLAMAGLRERYPNADDRELAARYARLTLGEELALKVYPELARLDP